MDNFPHFPTLLSIAAAVVLLIFILNRWLFGPLNAILQRRQAETDAARAEFDDARRVQEERLQQIEARLAEARREAYATRERANQEGRRERDEVLEEARRDTSARIEAAKAEIVAEVDEAKRQLEADADEIAAQIAGRLLGREVEPRGGR